MINYYLLTKPGIIFGNLVTFAAGFLLASRGEIDMQLFVAALLGLSCIIASACIFNNYIDRFMDKKMNRTKKRALVTGSITGKNAILFGVLLAIIGNASLLVYTNILTAAIANAGFIVYVFIYSFIKSRTSYSTLIGSIAGALPPLIGYCAVSNQLDEAAGILFLIMIFWQMPHFFAIALWHLKDYEKAGIPVLPVSTGILRTKIHMFLYILGLMPIVALLTLFNYTGYAFLTLTLSVCLAWLLLSIKGFQAEDNQLWGRQMFRLSLVMINAICFTLPFDLT